MASEVERAQSKRIGNVQAIPHESQIRIVNNRERIGPLRLFTSRRAPLRDLTRRSNRSVL